MVTDRLRRLPSSQTAWVRPDPLAGKRPQVPPSEVSSRVTYSANKHSGKCSVDDQFLLADAAYERGDFEEAFAKFLQLAEDGDLNGMSRVACMYGDGEGTPRSREKSLEWDSKAAALRSTTSMFNLGVTYRNAGDSREARRWFERLHVDGDGDASLELAKMYMVSDLEGERIKAYLLAAVQSSNVCEASREEAQELLDDLDVRGATDTNA